MRVHIWLECVWSRQKDEADFEVNHFSRHVTTKSTTDSFLSKFWALEEVPERKIVIREETHIEDHFSSTIRRNHEGRIVVQRPLKGASSNWI